jgi:D-hydroxyproline dehydrogenase subunit gamma
MPEQDLRMTPWIDRGPEVTILVDGQAVVAYEGETVAAALLATGQRTLRWTAGSGEPRGYFCGMGVCHDCLAEIDGAPSVRACMTPVREGLRVVRQRGLGRWPTGESA